MRIMDGEHVSAPWAKVDSTITIINKKKLIDIGIQGVKPLSREEVEAYKKIDYTQKVS